MLKKLLKIQKKVCQGLKGATDLVKKGFSGMALALKSIPVELFKIYSVLLKGILSQNQVVADAFAVAFGAISNIFNDFVNYLIDNFDKAVNPVKEFLSSDTFEGVENFFIGLITRVKNLIQGIGGLGKALVKVFKLDFEGAAEEAGEAFKI